MSESVKRRANWIIVADSSRAIIYTRETRRGEIKEAVTLENEFAAKKNAEFVSDRGGRSFDSHGHGRHTLTKEKADQRTQHIIVFAKKIAELVVNATRSGECREFALIVAPRFLGYLRDAMSTAPDVVATVSIDKSIVGEPVDVIEGLLSAN